jgi:hypothetical protein
MRAIGKRLEDDAPPEAALLPVFLAVVVVAGRAGRRAGDAGLNRAPRMVAAA